jgi:protease-4
MKFVRAIWKLLVGVKDALVLLLLLLFFGGLYGALSARPAPVKDGVLDLNLNGSVVEQPARRQWSDVASGGALGQYRLRDLVAAMDKARTDDRVKVVALDLDGFTGGGATAINDLAEAVRRVRGAGKPVVAYGVGYTDDSYALASAASEIWLNPLGGVLISGPGGSNLYYKGLLDKLGVTANVYRVGTYKSAVEPYIRNDMSPEARQNYQALDGARLETWKQAVKQARPKANIDLFLSNMNGAVAAAGGDMAKAALQAGLFD